MQWLSWSPSEFSLEAKSITINNTAKPCIYHPDPRLNFSLEAKWITNNNTSTPWMGYHDPRQIFSLKAKRITINNTWKSWMGYHDLRRKFFTLKVAVRLLLYFKIGKIWIILADHFWLEEYWEKQIYKVDINKFINRWNMLIQINPSFAFWIIISLRLYWPTEFYQTSLFQLTLWVRI